MGKTKREIRLYMLVESHYSRFQLYEVQTTPVEAIHELLSSQRCTIMTCNSRLYAQNFSGTSLNLTLGRLGLGLKAFTSNAASQRPCHRRVRFKSAIAKTCHYLLFK